MVLSKLQMLKTPRKTNSIENIGLFARFIHDSFVAIIEGGRNREVVRYRYHQHCNETMPIIACKECRRLRKKVMGQNYFSICQRDTGGDDESSGSRSSW